LKVDEDENRLRLREVIEAAFVNYKVFMLIKEGEGRG